MIIEIDITSDVPIYAQLVSQIKLGVLRGKLKPGDSLPSVRSLASDIGINLHTVNKSYKELVSEGLVTQVKKGYEISKENPPKISFGHLGTVRAQLENILIDAQVYDLDVSEMIEELTQKVKGDELDD